MILSTALCSVPSIGFVRTNMQYMKIRMCKRWMQVDILFTSPKHTHLRFFICKYLANDWENKTSRQHMAAACLYPATSSLWSWCQFPDPVYVFWLGHPPRAAPRSLHMHWHTQRTMPTFSVTAGGHRARPPQLYVRDGPDVSLCGATL